MANTQIDDLLRPLLLKDLRIQCRARGLNPGGSREALLDRVRENMLETGNIELVREFNGEVAIGVPQPVARPAEEEGAIGIRNNNYTRAEGQNVGNFITDKPSSRVLAPPGGHTSWSLSGDAPTDVIKARPAASPTKPVPEAVAAVAAGTAHLAAAAMPSKVDAAEDDLPRGEPAGGNNYTRPQGQNVGNFLTDKPSSRVLAPPGGGSSIVFG
ncbi:hypothetical protein ABPG77_008111 [Micractinium sp. CCAP 211/92]